MEKRTCRICPNPTQAKTGTKAGRGFSFCGDTCREMARRYYKKNWMRRSRKAKRVLSEELVTL